MLQDYYSSARVFDWILEGLIIITIPTQTNRFDGDSLASSKVLMMNVTPVVVFIGIIDAISEVRFNVAAMIAKNERMKVWLEISEYLQIL